MLTLDAALHIPDFVSFALVEQDAMLLNLENNQYYLLDDVGARLWALVSEGKSLRAVATPIMTDVIVLVTDCRECKSPRR